MDTIVTIQWILDQSYKHALNTRPAIQKTKPTTVTRPTIQRTEDSSYNEHRTSYTWTQKQSYNRHKNTHTTDTRLNIQQIED